MEGGPAEEGLAEGGLAEEVRQRGHRGSATKPKPQGSKREPEGSQKTGVLKMLPGVPEKAHRGPGNDQPVNASRKLRVSARKR